ncbi:TPA: ash family protein [Klebsiella pneumoniae]|nr:MULTISPECIES: ash family protein [Klebsiella]MDW1215482.1 ash family protein [Klebsiella pneumoniae]
MPAHTRIMVAQAGQPFGWPVSFGPVLRTPSGLPPLKRFATLVVAPITKLECAPCSSSSSRRSAVPIKNPIFIICPP